VCLGGKILDLGTGLKHSRSWKILVNSTKELKVLEIWIRSEWIYCGRELGSILPSLA
jgi:hypothetical protein